MCMRYLCVLVSLQILVDALLLSRSIYLFKIYLFLYLSLLSLFLSFSLSLSLSLKIWSSILAAKKLQNLCMMMKCSALATSSLVGMHMRERPTYLAILAVSLECVVQRKNNNNPWRGIHFYKLFSPSCSHLFSISPYSSQSLEDKGQERLYRVILKANGEVGEEVREVGVEPVLVNLSMWKDMYNAHYAMQTLCWELL